ncbi:MAG: hypothetical protein Q9167_000078 [Letrouitia subvulpina]
MGTVNSLPQRPVAFGSGSSRHSVVYDIEAPSFYVRTTDTVSIRQLMGKSPLLFAHVEAVSSRKVLRDYLGDPSQRAYDGTLTVFHHQDTFPATSWPVTESHFKALVHLSPGPNRIRLDFISPKLASTNSSNPVHSSWININFLPLISSPPLQLVILLGKDSPGIFDAVPERIQREGNGLTTAVQKYRMAAYLWQAFTGEQMYRNGFGRRCFRFEEEWQTGSLAFQDRETGQLRNEAKIHVVRSEKTVKEIRDLQLAQQYEKATRKDELFNIAMEAVKAHLKPAQGQKQYASVLLLDAHWDREVKTITGHAALGGGTNGIQIAIFGSQALQSYPTCLEEVIPAFTDCTRTDTNYVANDCNESGSNWEAANCGIGAHLHEIGHLFGCPHQESGIMHRDFVYFNRSFVCREPYSTRTRSPGIRLCQPKDECTWHRLDTLRFKYHPCFRLPTDPPLNSDESVQVWAVDNGKVMITAPTGITFVELFADGDSTCRAWIEYGNGDASSGSPPKQIVLTESDLKARLPEDQKNRQIKISVHSAGLGSHTIEDFGQLISKHLTVKLPNGQLGFKGRRLGTSTQAGSQPEQLILKSAFKQTKLLTSIKVFHGFAVDGIEFLYEDSTSQLFGKRGGRPGGSEFALDTRRGEILMGFYLRAGLWIDGLEILTSLGRRSGIFGTSDAGSG